MAGSGVLRWTVAASGEGPRFLRVRRPAVGDVLLALVFTGVAQVDVWAPGLAVWGDDPVQGPAVLNSVLLLLVTVPTAWRTVAPLAATTTAMVGVIVQAVVTGAPPIGLLLVGPVLTLVYSVAAYGTRRQAWLGLAATALATAVHDARDPRIRTPADVGEASYWWLVIAMAWVIGRYVASRRRARRQAEQARVREAALAAAEKDAVARERLRIAHELHDVVAHNIGVVALQAGAALELLDSSPARAREPLLAVEATARTTLREIRGVVGALRATDDTPGAPQPALADLATLAATVTDAGLPVEVTVHGAPRPLPAGVERSAYRVVQEALTNSLKHAAGASQARVHVSFEPHRLTLTIADDGPRRGDEPTHTSGHGLIGMRERVALHGGVLTAAPQPGGGFRVHAVLPLTQDQT